MIRITGGRLRGRRLRVAPGTRTRPSAARLREAIFSMVGARIEGARVADLFAGVGTLGIEALSRGAAHVLFVEIDPRSIRALRENLGDLDVDPSTVRVHRADAKRWLRRYAEEARPAPDRPRLLLMDPPYGGGDVLAHLLPPALRLLESAALDLCVIEHPSSQTTSPPLEAPSVHWTTRAHGHGAFTLIERTSDG